MAEVRANYFAELSSKCYQNQRLLTGMTFFVSSGAVATFAFKVVAESAPWLLPCLSLAAAALSAYNYATQTQKTAIEAADLHSKWSKLASEFERLWDDMYSVDALERLVSLEEKAGEYSKSAMALPHFPKRMAFWENHVQQQLGIPLQAGNH